MAYVAVKGGAEAIKASLALYEYERVYLEKIMDVESIRYGMNALIDQVMSESSFYDEELAALALKQAQGSMEEAVFLLRAHRSTLPRSYYTLTCEPESMRLKRRISSSFKDIPGGQLLGATPDFSQRFLKKELVEETKEDVAEKKQELAKYFDHEPNVSLRNVPRVMEMLEKEDLIQTQEKDNQKPDDITKKNIQFPATRSQRLQSLTRGQTGAVTSLGYASFRSHGVTSHPNIGELRVGELPLIISTEDQNKSLSKDMQEDSYYIGSIEVTEVVSFISAEKASESAEEAEKIFEVGYGMCYGQNETKTIAMSILDYALEHPIPNVVTTDEEFVLLHIDSVESTGFISHLKLPHYVTFQSSLDSIRKGKKGADPS